MGVSKMNQSKKPKENYISQSSMIIVAFLFMVAMPLVSAGIISSIESKIGGILVTLFGLGLLTAGTGAVGGSTHLKTAIIGGFTFIVGLGMIGGASFWDSFGRLWNWLR